MATTIATSTVTLTQEKDKKRKKHKVVKDVPDTAILPSQVSQEGEEKPGLLVTRHSLSDSPSAPSKKRKRDAEAAPELEINVSAPEPPSKKALRKAKKNNITPIISRASESVVAKDSSLGGEINNKSDKDETVEPTKRSEHGIWIGNLPWTATKPHLRTFFAEHGIAEDQVNRIHMPAPDNTTPSRLKVVPQNKGFAYIDFVSASALGNALALSETLMGGRRLLIKDAKNFEGRPEKTSSTDSKSVGAGVVANEENKSHSRRVFVGNLAFDATKDDLVAHFSPCGEVTDVFMATFEDSGKCKGFAWVTFRDVDAAEAAVKGYTYIVQENQNENNDEAVEEDTEMDGTSENKSGKPSKGPKPRKWFVNKLKGRMLRCEFAEDAATRYKKRYGKGAKAQGRSEGVEAAAEGVSAEGEVNTEASLPGAPPENVRRSLRLQIKERKQRRSGGRPSHAAKVDARTIKPGAALANAPRQTAAIVEAKGTKISFE